jgi:hypothetical protein
VVDQTGAVVEPGSGVVIRSMPGQQKKNMRPGGLNQSKIWFRLGGSETGLKPPDCRSCEFISLGRGLGREILVSKSTVQKVA